jgi:hypothetical protein
MSANAAYDRRGHCLLSICFAKRVIDTGVIRSSTQSRGNDRQVKRLIFRHAETRSRSILDAHPAPQR